MRVTAAWLAIGFILGGAAAAHAQARIEQGGWQGFTVPGADGKFGSCVLYNRTIDALNESPYHMLGLSRDGAGVGMLVFYRPGALKRGADVPVQLKFDQNAPLAVSGRAISDFHVRIDGPLPAPVVSTLRQARTLAVTAQGMTENFALQDVDAVLAALGDCVKANAPAAATP